MTSISIRTNGGVDVVEIPIEIVSAARKLVDDPWRYFRRPAEACLQPIECLIQDHVRWDGVERAIGYMQQAYDGAIERRPPLTVVELESGNYLVKDGNSTLTVAIAAGWPEVVCRVERIGGA